MAKNPWFRMYAEFLTDPKVQMLSETDQRRYIMLLCLKCNGDETLHDDEIAFQLRISNDSWLQTKELLIAKNLIDKQSKPIKWDDRQFVSDSSTKRVQRHRAKEKQECNVSVTPPDTDTDTDTDTKEKKNNNKKEKTTKIKTIITKTDLVQDGLTEQQASEFLAIRKNKGKSLTVTAWNDIRREAGKAGFSISQAIDHCNLNSWAGFRASWIENQKSANARASPTKNQHKGVSEKDYSYGVKEDGTVEF